MPNTNRNETKNEQYQREQQWGLGQGVQAIEGWQKEWQKFK